MSATPAENYLFMSFLIIYSSSLNRNCQRIFINEREKAKKPLFFLYLFINSKKKLQNGA